MSAQVESVLVRLEQHQGFDTFLFCVRQAGLRRGSQGWLDLLRESRARWRPLGTLHEQADALAA
jgi:hypothetical protein